MQGALTSTGCFFPVHEYAHSSALSSSNDSQMFREGLAINYGREQFTIRYWHTLSNFVCLPSLLDLPPSSTPRTPIPSSVSGNLARDFQRHRGQLGTEFPLNIVRSKPDIVDDPRLSSVSEDWASHL